MAVTLLASGALAQTSFPEIEPNTNKAEATTAGTITLTAGDSITGTTTGTDVTALSTLATTVDQFRVKTAALPVGIYRHRLTITSATVGHTGSLRGLDQSGTVGVGGTAGTVDTAIQTSLTTSTPPRFNTWYGFGKQEEIYYRVTGTTATTAAYAATLSTTPVTAGVIAPAFESANPITITTAGQTTVDTELMLYDSSLNAIAGGINDDAFGQTYTQSTLTRTLAPGVYYLAVSTFELCSNQVAPNDEDFVSGWLTDFPDCVALSSTNTTTVDFDFRVVASNGVWNQSNQMSNPHAPFDVTWWQFTVAAGAPLITPANDNCASATALPVAGGTVAGTMLNASNDGSASCDSGGAASRDVWYSYTNPFAGARLLSFSTCGTTGLNNTVVSVYNSCGGTEIGCNDDNAGCTAQPLTSLVSGILVNSLQTVLVRVSDKALGGTTQDFTLVTTVGAAGPPANDQCTSPIALSGFGTFAVDNLGATTGTQGQAEALCNQLSSTAVNQDTWFTWTPTASGTITVTTCGGLISGSQDTKIAVYNGAGCPTGAAIACNDDDPGACGGFASKLTFTAVCGSTYTIQLGMYPFTTATYTGNLFITGPGTPCSTPSTVFCSGDAVGTTCLGCGNNGAVGRGCANSGFASGALLVNGGISSVSADTMTLTASDIPGPGLFFQANGLAGSPINFGDGMLCAAVGIIRMGVVFPTAGVATYPGGLTPAPIGSFGATAGATLHYQCWYRDALVFCTASTFNTSNGISLTWTP